MLRPLILLFCWLGLLWVGGVSAAAEAPGATRVLRFVTYASERPAEELRKMAPFQRHIEQAMQAAGYPVRIDLRIFPSYGEAHDALQRGDFDFARIGPASYVLVRERKAPVKLLAVESFAGERFFDGVIFVREESALQTLSDVKGKRFAFGEQSSTTGSFGAQLALLKAGIAAADLAGFEYLGRHDKVALAVSSGVFDAGASNDKTFKKFQGRGLRAIERFKVPTQPWVVNTQLDARWLAALRQALLFIGPEALAYIDRDGFLTGNEADYAQFGKMMKQVDQFGGGVR